MSLPPLEFAACVQTALVQLKHSQGSLFQATAELEAAQREDAASLDVHSCALDCKVTGLCCCCCRVPKTASAKPKPIYKYGHLRVTPG